jgi:hypothetical protein
VTLIYAATGRLAFGADSVSAVMHRILYEEPDVNGLPPSLRAIARECLDKDPGRRPSARDLLLRLVDPSARRAAAAAPVPPAMSGPPTWGPGSGPPPLADSPPPGWAAATGPVYPAGGPTAPGGYPSLPAAPGGLASRSRRGPLLAACGVAAAAVIALGVVLFAHGSTSGPSAGQGSGSPASHPASPAATRASQPASPAATQTTQATPSPGARIPASFAGTWSGTATMAALGDGSFGLKNTISFAAGGRTAHEIDQDCVNTLTLTRATAAVMVFSEPGTAACVAGTVTFTRHGSELAYRWTDNIEQNTAVLRKP